MSQCWAHNKQGQRCTLNASHDSPHEIRFTWSDEECFVPGERKPSAVPSTTQETAEPPPVCVACKHTHKGGLCKCGCHTHIG